jgi:hypothetical protein
LTFDHVRFDGPLTLVKNVSGGTRSQGDVLVLARPTVTSAPEARLALEDGEAGACVVAMSSLNSVYDGRVMFVAPVNTRVDAVRVEGPVQAGDLLEVTTSATAHVNNEPAAYTAIGRALTGKGDGLGTVKMGPA